MRCFNQGNFDLNQLQTAPAAEMSATGTANGAIAIGDLSFANEQPKWMPCALARAQSAAAATGLPLLNSVFSGY
jgi:hypothetical protein